MRNKKAVKAIFVALGIVSVIIFSLWFIHKIYPLKYTDYIKKYSKQYNIDPYLIAALIKAESNYKNSARSHKNANGLMQITVDTGEWIAFKMNIENYSKELLYDPETNIRMGCWYLDNLRGEFGNNVELILAAYNAGRGNVNNWLKNQKYSYDGKKLDFIPFKETDQYIKRIKTNYNIYKFIYKEAL